MRIGKLFHLTPLVDDLAAAERFFLNVFAPWCMARNYSSHWHRTADLFVVADTVIEPFQPHPPAPGASPSSWFRYMDKYGPRVLNMAFFVDDAPALERRLRQAGVRTTDAQVPEVVFCFPKDTPGTLEFMETSAFGQDPRLVPGYESLRDEFWGRRHPLGLQRLSHLTVAVHDGAAAERFYVDVLDAVPLPRQNPTFSGTEARHLLVGEDTVVELAQPAADSSPVGPELAHAGEHVVAATFTVADLERAAEHLERAEAPAGRREAAAIELDHHETWGLRYRFSEASLEGDPRVAS